MPFFIATALLAGAGFVVSKKLPEEKKTLGRLVTAAVAIVGIAIAIFL